GARPFRCPAAGRSNSGEDCFKPMTWAFQYHSSTDEYRGVSGRSRGRTLLKDATMRCRILPHDL
ncbi:MAG: hypothetical protein KAJ13_03415, partial [Gemmatimonadetes bacterium]|nr:hypothetical protein [Gemmatimonadota bacterium]